MKSTLALIVLSLVSVAALSLTAKPALRPEAARPAIACSSVLLSTGAAAAPAPPPPFVLPLVASLAAGVAAGAELLEDVSDVGHAHGVVLLAWSRLAGALREFSKSVGESIEAIEGEAKGKLAALLRTVVTAVTSKMFTSLLGVVAFSAAAKEVFEDVAPGGHHGAVLVAMNHVFENLEAADIKLWGLTSLFMESSLLQFAVHGLASASAALEVFRDFFTASGFKLGGHYGVLLIALSGLITEAYKVYQAVTAKKDKI